MKKKYFLYVFLYEINKGRNYFFFIFKEWTVFVFFFYFLIKGTERNWNLHREGGSGSEKAAFLEPRFIHRTQSECWGEDLKSPEGHRILGKFLLPSIWKAKRMTSSKKEVRKRPGIIGRILLGYREVGSVMPISL